MKNKRCLMLIALFNGNVLTAESLASEPSPAEVGSGPSSWLSSGRLSLTGRALEENEEYASGLLMPVWLPESSALFLDVRGSFLDDAEEINAGLVGRHHFKGLGIILGANAYYDGRWTDSDTRFDQAAGGLEIMSRWIDARANYYHPVTDETILGDSIQTNLTYRGGRWVRTRTLYRSYEEALDGYDAEIGVWLPWISRHVPTAVHAGYYQFNSDLIEDDEFGGMKARLEARVHPNVTISGEWFEEAAINQSEYIAAIRLQVPLDFWNKAFVPASGGPYNPLSERMSEEVQRDLRIRVIKTGPIEYASSTTSVFCRDIFIVDPVTGTVTVKTVCQ